MKIKVLYLLGSSRSGSTVIDNILNEINGFFSVGEMRFLAERIRQGRLCGCGLPVRQCDVWQRVLGDRHEGLPESLLVQSERWQREAVRTHHTWRILRRVQGRGHVEGALRRYADLAGALYASVADVTQSRVIVDSSKRPSNGALLGLMREVTPYFVHIVRDPRAMVYSEWRRKPTPDPMHPEMPQSPPHRTAVIWTGWNLAANAVRGRYASGLLIRYEDFVSRPQSTIESICRLVGEERGSLPFVDERTVQLGGNHTVSGNASRFAKGLVSVREDDEWMRRMPRSHKVLTTALTLPLLSRYGYPVQPSRGRSPALTSKTSD